MNIVTHLVILGHSSLLLLKAKHSSLPLKIVL